MSRIEWTDETWNPFVGCSKISPACDNCYAERMACRLAANPKTPAYAGAITDGKWNGNICEAPESVWMKPFQWKKPKRIFVGSMTDVFHKNVPDHLLDKLLGVMSACPQHTFMLLTKRADRMNAYISSADRENICWNANMMLKRPHIGRSVAFPLPNVWLGVTAENQEQADKRIPVLLDTPAAKRFVSIEPMLGPVDIEEHLLSSYDKAAHDVQMPFGLSRTDKLDWVIAGGESGPNARPSHPDWFRSLRDQCAEWGTPFFFKQWGEWEPQSGVQIYHARGGNPPSVAWPDGKISWGTKDEHGGFGTSLLNVGKKAAGHLLDGQEWRQIPEVE